MKYKDIITGEVKEVLSTSWNRNRKQRSRYNIMRECVRESAREWQYDAMDKDYSYGELLYFQGIFEKYGKRYGLLREFRENGII